MYVHPAAECTPGKPGAFRCSPTFAYANTSLFYRREVRLARFSFRRSPSLRCLVYRRAVRLARFSFRRSPSLRFLAYRRAVRLARFSFRRA